MRRLELCTLLLVTISLSSCSVLDKEQERLLTESWNDFNDTNRDTLLSTFSALDIELEKEKPYLKDGRLVERYSITFRNSESNRIQTVEYHVRDGKVFDSQVVEDREDQQSVWWYSEYDHYRNQNSVGFLFYGALYLLTGFPYLVITYWYISVPLVFIRLLVDFIEERKKRKGTTPNDDA